MKSLSLYTIFHLNLAYSSIEEHQRQDVIRRCYWPLLRLARDLGIPIGIEATGYTLETIADLEPEWFDELHRLNDRGLCEFIGSGFAQIIGPLVPAEVNAANLRIGHQVYKHLLGFKPEIALINEQAFSAGLVGHYVRANYKAVVMEWDNPALHHPEWAPEWRYLPQRACGLGGEAIPIIWSKSIAFQKFQRYAHGEMELEEYLIYLGGHASIAPRVFPLYANDVEIFDFRPGRYETEAVLHKEGEWIRIRKLIENLSRDKRFRFILPCQVLDLLSVPGAGNKIRLESPEQPIPVKKQGKYNITRWAVTGPDDLRSNTACWRIYEKLARAPDASDQEWKELCYLWGSDFRTHITRLRWRQYWRRINNFEHKLKKLFPERSPSSQEVAKKIVGRRRMPRIVRQGKFLTVETGGLTVRLNNQKGLAIDGVWLPGHRGPSLYGTLPHGYYDDISLGSDWYTGHVVLESPGNPKVTDLNAVEPTQDILEKSGDVRIMADIPTSLGLVTKTILISAMEPTLTLSYKINWKRIPQGSFRVGNITLNPESFDRASLWFRTENGGNTPETLLFGGRKVEHGDPVSFLVSARHGLGITGGWVEIGDKRHRLRIVVDKVAAALIGLISYQNVNDTYFCRLALSAGEMDETPRLNGFKAQHVHCLFSLRYLRDVDAKTL